MNAAAPPAAAGDADIAETLFLLPADAKCLPVSELTARLRERIGPVGEGQSVITRPGFRLIPRLVAQPLAALVDEFRQPSLITDAVYRFSRAHDQEPVAILEQAFDALAALVEGRILVPSDSAAAGAPEPSLGAGQSFGPYEIETLVRSLDDTEIYRARDQEGRVVALKIARDDRAEISTILRHEAGMLEQLGGGDTPRLYGCGSARDRPFVAMQWCEGTSIAVAAQQARAARDRPRLHGLIARMFEAYARLHERGILHGDIHTANCLIGDDGRVVILDFGAAMRIGDPGNVVRGGIPHFHDPQMARAMLARRMPPPASAISEQYSLCVLAYLLLTGLHPVQSSAVQEDLLHEIVRRPPLPFAARGVATWPEAEKLLGRGLAKSPARRFPDVAGLAHAWASIPAPSGRPGQQRRPRGLAGMLERIKTHPSSPHEPVERAWLALRGALAFDDPELLAAAEMLIAGAGPGWAASGVAAQVARAQSDAAAEQRAIDRFLAKVAGLADGPEPMLATLAAAEMLDGIGSRRVDAGALLAWLGDSIAGASGAAGDAMALRVALAIGRTKALPYPGDLRHRLDRLAREGAGDAWLWADAHFAFGSPRFLRRALAAPPPTDPAAQAFALLRLHQATGGTAWVEVARSRLAGLTSLRRCDLLTTLLAIELHAPERALLPAFLLPRILS